MCVHMMCSIHLQRRKGLGDTIHIAAHAIVGFMRDILKCRIQLMLGHAGSS